MIGTLDSAVLIDIGVPFIVLSAIESFCYSDPIMPAVFALSDNVRITLKTIDDGATNDGGPAMDVQSAMIVSEGGDIRICWADCFDAVVGGPLLDLLVHVRRF